jgi:hypothetical protein
MRRPPPRGKRPCGDRRRARRTGVGQKGLVKHVRAIFAALKGSPAQLPAQSEPLSASVAYTDLDLASPAGRVVLQQRIFAAFHHLRPGPVRAG